MQSIFPILLVLCLYFCIVKEVNTARQGPGRVDGARRPRYGHQAAADPNFPPPEPDSPYGSEYYDQDGMDDPYYNAPPRSKRPKDIVSTYTSTISQKLIVALVAAISTGVLSHFLLMMIISRSHSLVLFCLSLLGGLSVFFRGDLGDFSRSLGVFTMLVLLRAAPSKFMLRLVRQLKAFVSSRRPFPPRRAGEEGEAEGEEVEYSAGSALFSLSLACALLGWQLKPPIPLLPRWLFALACAGGGSYGGSLQAPLGDLLRLLGFTLSRALGELGGLADETQLRPRTSSLLAQLFSFLKGVDEQFHIGEKGRALLARVVAFLTAMIYNVRGVEIGGAEGEDEGGRRGGKKKKTARGKKEYEEGEYYDDAGQEPYAPPPYSYPPYDDSYPPKGRR